MEDRLEKIKRAGFDATSLWWGDNIEDKQPDLARKIGLEIDNIHAPFYNPNSLWTDNLAGEDYLNMLISCVNDCKTYDMPTVVIHITDHTEHVPITELGLNRVRKLIDIAEKQEINLAFENMNYLEHLDYIFEHIDSPRLGFCYDSGHENYRHPDADCLSRYGHRLFAIHLDDNFGDSDLHLLPYDGTINWTNIKRKIDASKKLNYITLEVDFAVNHEKSVIYKSLSADEFLALAYQRAQKFIKEE